VRCSCKGRAEQRHYINCCYC